MYRIERAFWGLLAVGGAIAVGLTTHDAGFVVITFLGGLWLPRILGLRPSLRSRMMAYGRHGKGWGGGCAGAEHRGADTQTSTSAPQSV